MTPNPVVRKKKKKLKWFGHRIQIWMSLKVFGDWMMLSTELMQEQLFARELPPESQVAMGVEAVTNRRFGWLFWYGFHGIVPESKFWLL